MQAPRDIDYRLIVVAWIYGLICGLGIAATMVGILRGEGLPGVAWPALIPLLCAPLLALTAMHRKNPPAPPE